MTCAPTGHGDCHDSSQIARSAPCTTRRPGTARWPFFPSRRSHASSTSWQQISTGIVAGRPERGSACNPSKRGTCSKRAFHFLTVRSSYPAPPQSHWALSCGAHQSHLILEPPARILPVVSAREPSALASPDESFSRRRQGTASHKSREPRASRSSPIISGTNFRPRVPATSAQPFAFTRPPSLQPLATVHPSPPPSARRRVARRAPIGGRSASEARRVGAPRDVPTGVSVSGGAGGRCPSRRG
jgi:hypothetical protein